MSSSRHAVAIRESTSVMRISGSAATLTSSNHTAPGAPMKIVGSVYGARPYPDFKDAIDAALAQAR